MIKTTVVAFRDVEENAEHVVRVEHETQGVGIIVPGFGLNDTEPGAGPVVLLEIRNGVPFVVVWADITKEEPTHTISLLKASETFRPSTD